MKRLFILRHAQADAPMSGSDFERTLTDLGHTQAKALGTLMQEKDYRPARVLCSSATRTRQTFEGVNQTFENLPFYFEKDIYNATTGDLLAMIQRTTDSVDTLMIIGHNPYIYDLALRLAVDEQSQATQKLSTGYAPATLSVLDCQIESWAEIQLHQNKVHDVCQAIEYCSEI